MDMKTSIIPAFIIAIVLFSVACKKNPTDVAGKGGNATLNIFPQHHTVAKNLVNMTVYVKYNTSDAPANNVYDDSMACTNHDSLVSCTFTGLKNGNYYFFAHGYDNSIAQNVKGGAPYKITEQKTQSFNLPVSEE
jgi:hypothetical protein